MEAGEGVVSPGSCSVPVLFRLRKVVLSIATRTERMVLFRRIVPVGRGPGRAGHTGKNYRSRGDKSICISLIFRYRVDLSIPSILAAFALFPPVFRKALRISSAMGAGSL